MTGNDLKIALDRIGWTGGELARRIGVSRNTVSGWTTGKHPIPKLLVEYLALIEAIKELAS